MKSLIRSKAKRDRWLKVPGLANAVNDGRKLFAGGAQSGRNGRG